LTTTELIFARHGQTDWNAEGRIQGHNGPGLNDPGRQQSRELAQSLIGTGIDAIYSSDLERARGTAEIVGEALSMPITVDGRLRERNHGAWEGKTSAELSAEIPDWKEQWTRWALDGSGPGGESIRQVVVRIAPLLDEISAQHSGGRVLVVTHDGVIAILRTIAANLSHEHAWGFRTGNCEITEMAWPMQTTPDAWIAQFGSTTA
jgi:2,3-bisphosphoglycerate-dependent phosphoglycerate mutase